MMSRRQTVEMIRMIIICASWLCAAAAGRASTPESKALAQTRTHTRRRHADRTHLAHITHTNIFTLAAARLHTAGVG